MPVIYSDVSELKDQGEYAIHYGDYWQAVDVYTEALDVCKTERHTLYFQRAYAHQQLGNYDKALLDAQFATKEQSKHEKGYEIQLQCAIKLEKWRDAYATTQKCERLFPENALMSQHKEEVVKHVVQLEAAAQSESDVKDKQKKFKKAIKESEAKFLRGNYLKLCGQDPYPGDYDKLQADRKWAAENKYIEPVYVEFRKPNPDSAGTQRNMGERMMETGETDKAFLAFTKALELFPMSMKNWYNRAWCLYELELYPQAYNHIANVTEGERNAELWKLAGKIMIKAERFVLAELNLKKASKLQNYEDEETLQLFQLARTKRLYDPVCENLPIRVEFHPETGKGVFAHRDIEEGEEIMRDEPLIITQTLDSQIVAPACYMCARDLLSAEDYFSGTWAKMPKNLKNICDLYWPKCQQFGCKEGCDKELYCSEHCRDKAYSTYHRVLCPKLNPGAQRLWDFHRESQGVVAKALLKHLSGKEATSQTQAILEKLKNIPSPMFLARMWAIMTVRAENMVTPGNQPTTEQWAGAKSIFRRFIGYGTEGYAEKVGKLVDIMNEAFNNDTRPVNYPITQKEYEIRYYQMACNTQAYGQHVCNYKVFTRALKANKIDMTQFDDHWRGEPAEALFGGMFDLHASLNHACVPNCNVVDDFIGDTIGVKVVTTRAVKKGEELTIPYIDIHLPRLQRRTGLHEGWSFWCQCARCRFEGDDPTECTECGKEAPEDKPYKACSRCKQAWYCSPTCQKKAWAAGHKHICNDDKDSPVAEKKGMATPMDMWELVSQGVEEASKDMERIMEKF